VPEAEDSATPGAGEGAISSLATGWVAAAEIEYVPETEHLRLPVMRQVGLGTYGLVAAAMIVVVGLAGWFGFAALGGTTLPQQLPQAEVPVHPVVQPTASSVLSKPAVLNPTQFVAAGSGVPANGQACDGLLGLCLGEHISVALGEFRTPEVAGAPHLLEGGGECHVWASRSLFTATVCETSDYIVSIRVDVSTSGATVAGPHQLVLGLPATVGSVGQLITAQLGAQPYSAEYAQSVFRFSWRLTDRVDMPRLTLVTRPAVPSGSIPVPCSENAGFYPVSGLLATANRASVVSVEVATPDFSEPGVAPTSC
jgi:hypothetical protein